MAITNSHRSAEAKQLFKHPEYKLVNDKVVKFTDVTVYEFTMGDVEDPDLFVAEPIWNWQQSDAGRFIMEHAEDKPYWHRSVDHTSYGHVYRIVARLSEQNETFWKLKWGNIK